MAGPCPWSTPWSWQFRRRGKRLASAWRMEIEVVDPLLATSLKPRSNGGTRPTPVVIPDPIKSGFGIPPAPKSVTNPKRERGPSSLTLRVGGRLFEAGAIKRNDPVTAFQIIGIGEKLSHD